MAINDLHKCTVVGTLHAQTTLTSLYYISRSAGGNADTLGTAVFQNIIQPMWLPIVSSDWLVVRVDTQTYSAPNMLFVVSQNIDLAGGTASASVPSTVAVVIRKRTANAGRKWRGRWYIPACPAVSTLRSELIPTALTDFNDLAIKLATQVVDAGGAMFDPILVSKWKAGGVTGGTPLTQCIADQILRSQRRRQIGVGI